MDTVKVIELRMVNNNRPLKAFADVDVGGWIIRDFRIIKQNGGRAYVSPPQTSWKDPETRQIMFKGILTIPAEQKQLIELAILTAYQGEMERMDGNPKQ